jgi:hypothetical protein
MIKRVTGVLLILLLAAACFKKENNSPPGAFSLALPLNGQVCTTGTVISATQSKVGFAWGAAANANNYDLTITNLLTHTAITHTVQKTTDTATLLQNTPYSWYITAKAPKTTTTLKSDTWRFYCAGSGLITYAPFPATIVSPTFGQTVTSTGGNINLAWTGSSVTNNIVGYNVYFGPSTNPALFRTSITDNFVNNVAVSANTTYYWHVVTIDANGNISDSGIYNFFVK